MITNIHEKRINNKEKDLLKIELTGSFKCRRGVHASIEGFGKMIKEMITTKGFFGLTKKV